jgi:SAM-dependent methyltransferase
MPDTTTQYLHGHHESVLRSHRWRTAANSAAYLLPSISRGMAILDVGCGPGTITLDLARLVAPGGRVVGLDAVEAPLLAARVDAVNQSVANVSFLVGDVYDLPFEDAGFDIVHAHQVLQHLGDPVAALREMARVCKPGGVVAARDSDYEAMTWFPVDPLLDDWLELYRLTARASGGEPDAGRRLLGWAHAAGLADATPSASAWCYASVADRLWWGDLWADRVVSSTFAQQALIHGLATREQLEDISTAWRRWGDNDDAWFAILHGEILCRVAAASVGGHR